MKISIIVAVSKNNVIGAKNKLLWHIPEDLKRFKSLTTGHHILMGQKTFESIGKVLPNRTNLILSGDKDLNIPEAFVFSSVKKALDFAKTRSEKELFVIGGGIVYKELLPLTSKIYMTSVIEQFEGDTYFPTIDLNEWTEVFNEKHLEQNLPYEFKILERK